MPVSEAYLGFQFLYGILAPDTTLQSYAPGGVFRSEADPGTTPPFVIIGLQSPGVDTMTITAVRLLSNPLYQIRAVGPASLTQQVANAASQIDVLLGGKDGLRNQSIANGFIAACYRENVLQLDEIVNGELITSIGGLYRLIIEAI